MKENNIKSGKSKKYSQLLIIMFIMVIVVLDQASKIWVKTHMTLGQEHEVVKNILYILFTENPGMAFGLTFGYSVTAKLILTFARIGIAFVLVFFLFVLSKSQHINSRVNTGLLLGLSAIFAGAIGNIIDSTFYGIVFSDSLGQLAQFMPPDGGYEGVFMGNVVDMIYCPIIEKYPDWFPIMGGKEFMFFRANFNVADISIMLGFIYILLLQRRTIHNLIANKVDKSR